MLTSKPSLLDRLKAGVQKTRAGLIEKIEDAFSGRKEIDADVLEELEYALITADIGAATTNEILERIRQRMERRLAGDVSELKGLIRQYLLEILQANERPVHRADTPPTVIMVVGVNGTGKTTSIGKLTRRLQSEGNSVLRAVVRCRTVKVTSSPSVVYRTTAFNSLMKSQRLYERPPFNASVSARVAIPAGYSDTRSVAPSRTARSGSRFNCTSSTSRPQCDESSALAQIRASSSGDGGVA